MDEQRIKAIAARLGQITAADVRLWPELYMAASELVYGTGVTVITVGQAARTLNSWAQPPLAATPVAAPVHAPLPPSPPLAMVVVERPTIVPPPAAPQTYMSGREVANGYYTVELAPGTRYTFRVNPWKAKNCQFISFLSGPNNTSDYTGCATLDAEGVRMLRSYRSEGPLVDAVKVLVATPDRGRFSEAYAQQSGRCARCNRMLTVPASIARGLGPECMNKAA